MGKADVRNETWVERTGPEVGTHTCVVSVPKEPVSLSVVHFCCLLRGFQRKVLGT